MPSKDGPHRAPFGSSASLVTRCGKRHCGAEAPEAEIEGESGGEIRYVRGLCRLLKTRFLPCSYQIACQNRKVMPRFWRTDSMVPKGNFSSFVLSSRVSSFHG
jgi:hypothetical protein